jgi:hypothetical protein
MKIIKRANEELKTKIRLAAIEKLTRLNVESGEDRMHGRCNEYKIYDSGSYRKGEGYIVNIANNRNDCFFIAYLDNDTVVLKPQENS